MDLSSVELWYLGQPYTLYPRGLSAAYLEGCRLASSIQKKYGAIVFAPIAHSHGIALHGGLPVMDGTFWERFNRPFVNICGGLIVGMMDGWTQSRGLAHEINEFGAAKKPIAFIWPDSLHIEWGNPLAVETINGVGK